MVTSAEHRHAGVAHTENEVGAVGAVIDLFIRALKLCFAEDRFGFQHVTEENDIGCENRRQSRQEHRERWHAETKDRVFAPERGEIRRRDRPLEFRPFCFAKQWSNNNGKQDARQNAELSDQAEKAAIARKACELRREHQIEAQADRDRDGERENVEVAADLEHGNDSCKASTDDDAGFNRLRNSGNDAVCDACRTDEYRQ